MSAPLNVFSCLLTPVDSRPSASAATLIGTWIECGSPPVPLQPFNNGQFHI